FYFISDNSSFYLDIILCFNENLQIQQISLFRMISHKNTLYQNARCRRKSQHLARLLWVVEGVRLAVQSLPIPYSTDVVRILLEVNGIWRVEIRDPLVIQWLKVSGFIVVVLRNQTNLIGVEEI